VTMLTGAIAAAPLLAGTTLLELGGVMRS
jgi:hypothetical protein